MENKTDDRWRTGGASWLIPLLLCVSSYIDSIPPWCGIVKVNSPETFGGFCFHYAIDRKDRDLRV